MHRWCDIDLHNFSSKIIDNFLSDDVFTVNKGSELTMCVSINFLEIRSGVILFLCVTKYGNFMRQRLDIFSS